MSTQVKHGRSIHGRNGKSKTQLQAPFVGTVGVTPHVPDTRWRASEPSRRDDGLKPNRFGDDVPTLNSSNTDHHSIANAPKVVTFDHVQTTHGSVRVPREREQLNYLPNVSELQAAPMRDSRMTVQQQMRYFR